MGERRPATRVLSRDGPGVLDPRVPLENPKGKLLDKIKPRPYLSSLVIRRDGPYAWWNGMNSLREDSECRVSGSGLV